AGDHQHWDQVGDQQPNEQRRARGRPWTVRWVEQHRRKPNWIFSSGEPSPPLGYGRALTQDRVDLVGRDARRSDCRPALTAACTDTVGPDRHLYGRQSPERSRTSVRALARFVERRAPSMPASLESLSGTAYWRAVAQSTASTWRDAVRSGVWRNVS